MDKAGKSAIAWPPTKGIAMAIRRMRAGGMSDGDIAELAGVSRDILQGVEAGDLVVPLRIASAILAVACDPEVTAFAAGLTGWCVRDSAGSLGHIPLDGDGWGYRTRLLVAVHGMAKRLGISVTAAFGLLARAVGKEPSTQVVQAWAYGHSGRRPKPGDGARLCAVLGLPMAEMGFSDEDDCGPFAWVGTARVSSAKPSPAPAKAPRVVLTQAAPSVKASVPEAVRTGAPSTSAKPVDRSSGVTGGQADLTVDLPGDLSARFGMMIRFLEVGIDDALTYALRQRLDSAARSSLSQPS
jgi:hypothetical protein